MIYIKDALKTLLQEQFEQYLNANCSLEEKGGKTGPGSCGGKVDDESTNTLSPVNTESKQYKLRDETTKKKYYEAKEPTNMIELSEDDVRGMDDNELNDHINKHVETLKKASQGSLGLLLGIGKEKKQKVLQSLVNNQHQLERELDRRARAKFSDLYGGNSIRPYSDAAHIEHDKPIGKARHFRSV